MAQPINVAVRCPKCNWRVMDKISPTTGKIEIKCPRCHRVVEVDLALRRVVSYIKHEAGSDNRIRSKCTEQRVIVP